MPRPRPAAPGAVAVLWGKVHHDHGGQERGVPGGPGGRQRDVHVTSWSGPGVGGPSARSWPLRWPVGDGVQVGQRPGVTEDHRGQRRTVDQPLGVHDPPAEPVDQGPVGGPPGSTTSRAIRSASTSTAPWSTSRSATVDLPARSPRSNPRRARRDLLRRPGGAGTPWRTAPWWCGRGRR